MAITREQFTKLMMEYGFARFPRAIGNPRQSIIHDFNTFLVFYRLNNGKFPVYTSANSYWDFDKYGNPTNTYFEKMFFDVDVDTGCNVEKSHKDCQVLAEFCQENNIPFTTCFSGNGFHFYIYFKPKMYTIDMKLTLEMRAIQSYLKSTLKLKTVNIVCAEPRRMVRVPLSRYVTGKEIDGWTVKDRYCIPLTYDQLQNNKLRDIMILSKHPVVLSKYKEDGKYLKVKHFLEKFKIKPKNAVTYKATPQEYMECNIDYTQIAETDIYKIVEMLVPHKCLNEMIWMKNPPHFIRFSFCTFLVNIMSREEAINLFDKIAHDAEWNDRFNKTIRDYQIDNIYNNMYTTYSCEELNNHGVCRGSSCPRYKKYIKMKNNGKVGVKDES